MVFGIAGNKCDLFSEEQVSENEVKAFAKSIGAVFHLTSAQDNIGITELFTDLGEKYLEVKNIIQKKGGEEERPKGVALTSDSGKKEKGKKKKQKIANARSIAMYLSRALTDESLERIGLEIGGRDHSTVIHHYEKVSKELTKNIKLQEEIKILKQKICE